MKPQLIRFLLSSTVMELVYGRESLKLPRAIPVDAPEPGLILPSPRVTTNLDTEYWGGEEYHYDLKDSDGVEEQFSIHIIDIDVSPEDEDGLHDIALSPRTDIQLASAFDKRNWVCQWVVACFDFAHYVAEISAAQIAAASTSLGYRLRANNYQLVREALNNVVTQFAIGIASNIASWYITNKIQAQDTKGLDRCDANADSIAKLERTIELLQADLRSFMEDARTGRNGARMFDHFSEDPQQGVEGKHLKHTVKQTTDPNDAKWIKTC